jgi:hypothetical protein
MSALQTDYRPLVRRVGSLTLGPLSDAASNRQTFVKNESGAYLGTCLLGGIIPFRIQCRDWMTGVAVKPDKAPWARVLDSFGATVELVKGIGTEDTNNVTGLFMRKHRVLDPDYAIGHYSVVYSYLVGGRVYSMQDRFEIVGGGDLGGSVISVYSQHHPGVDYVLAHLSSGVLAVGFGPSLGS